MKDSRGILPLNSQSPFIQLLVSLIILLFVSSFLVLISLLAGRIIFGMGIQDIGLDTVILSSAQRNYIKFIQALQHLSIFLIPALVAAYFMTGDVPGYLRMKRSPGPAAVIVVFFLALVIIPLSGDLGVLNSNLSLPSWLSGLEEWMRKKEADAGVLTGWLIYSGTKSGLVVNIIIIAILPALGEEFLFRGLFQQIFTRMFRSAHPAIFITAILFSASHFQFFGFLPRLMLGLIYGYLFFWSGSIWLPVIAHFINNLVPVVAAHYVGWESINGSVQQYFHGTAYNIIIPSLLIVLLMIVVRDLSKNQRTT